MGWEDDVVNTRRLGEMGERVAELFLTLKGYRTLQRNYRYAGREVDLLMRTDRDLIAVEVKLRRGDRYGHAAEAIDARKLNRLHVALAGAAGGMREKLRPRVDIVAIDFDNKLEAMTVRHIEAAG